MTRDDIVRLMTKDIAHSRPSGIRPAARPAEAGPARLTVRGLSAEPRFETIDLDAHAGRIVGIAGVQGSGHGAFVRAVGGLDPVDTGTVSVEGRKMVAGSARRSVQHGILTVPADRRGAAIVPPMSVRGNLALSDRIREKARRWGLRWRRVERDMIQGYIRDLDIRPPNGETRIANLSGGNQQKVALARVLEGSASVLLVEEPTQGIDVGAKAEIHELLRRVARDTNCAVVIATSEFEELIGLADDIYVMRSGRMVKHIPGPEATYHAILESALP